MKPFMMTIPKSMENWLENKSAKRDIDSIQGYIRKLLHQAQEKDLRNTKKNKKIKQ